MQSTERINQRDMRELERRKRQQAKPTYSMYLIVMCAVVILVHIVDEIASSLGSMVQSSIVNEFFVVNMGMEYNEGLASMALLSIVSGQISVLAPFYKALADKFGRKMFLVVNTIGFALGLFICSLANNFVVYAIGFSLISFFVAHDMQVVFILESAPKEKRATIYAITKCLGTVGLVLVPILRRVFLDADATNWRPLFVIPAVVGLAVGIIGQLFIRETSVFVDSRIAYLEKPYEERHPKKEKKAVKEKKKDTGRKAGVFPAIKYLFTHNKDLRWLTLTYVILSTAMIPLSGYYESIMTTGGMTTAQITDAQFVYPFGYAAIILAGGLIGDRFGRKNTSVFTGVMSMVTFCLFVYGVANGWNSYLIGALYSMFLGGYWTCMDYLSVMASEKVPTDVRGSVLGAMNLIQFVGIGLGMGCTIGGLAILSSTPVGIICSVVAVPILVVSLFLLVTKVKETKGTDLDSIE